jgi:hypothetical protein
MSSAPQYVPTFLEALNPDETHNAGGDCINPKCNYEFTDADKSEIARNNGWFTCPNCDWTYNYYSEVASKSNPGGMTRAGLTMKQVGDIGQTVVTRMGDVPGVGEVTWISEDYTDPIDAIIGGYACEIKTNHSESTPRFKLGGAHEVLDKKLKAEEFGLPPALIGVRLNFYSDMADIFFRPQLTDTWIGNPQMFHIAKVDFTDLNPYKSPSEVPPPDQLPEDDETPPKDEFPF